MVLRNAIFEVEEIEQPALIDLLPTHHDLPPAAENRRQTESRFADHHEGFFNSIDPKQTATAAQFQLAPEAADDSGEFAVSPTTGWAAFRHAWRARPAMLVTLGARP